MNVCITSSGNTLESKIDPRFGRCSWFLFVNTDDGAFAPVENQYVEQGAGAGIEAAHVVADCHPVAVLTGQCGPQALRVLETAGIKAITGCGGAARDLIEQIRHVGLAKVGSLGDESAGGGG
jgi:predicted Fe-Mo cluster-binding NifX family protein